MELVILPTLILAVLLLGRSLYVEATVVNLRITLGTSIYFTCSLAWLLFYIPWFQRSYEGSDGSFAMAMGFIEIYFWFSLTCAGCSLLRCESMRRTLKRRSGDRE